MRASANEMLIEALVKAKVNGIYSTTPAELLSENSFEIVKQSLTAKKRFELTPALKLVKQKPFQNSRRRSQAYHKSTKC